MQKRTKADPFGPAFEIYHSFQTHMSLQVVIALQGRWVGCVPYYTVHKIMQM